MSDQNKILEEIAAKPWPPDRPRVGDEAIHAEGTAVEARGIVLAVVDSKRLKRDARWYVVVEWTASGRGRRRQLAELFEPEAIHVGLLKIRPASGRRAPC